MPAKASERKRAKMAHPPKDYNYSNDTVYTSFEGLKLGNALRSAKPFNNPIRFAAALPEAALLSLMLYYFAVIFPESHNALDVLAVVVVFYILDSFLGALTGLAKTVGMNSPATASFGSLVAASFTSLQPLTYLAGGAELYLLVSAPSSSYTFIAGIILILLYLATIRFGMIPMLMVQSKGRTRAQAAGLSLQYFGGSFMSLLGLNIVSLIIPIAIAFAFAAYPSLYMLAAMLVVIVIFMGIWQNLECSAFTIIGRKKRVSYVVS